MPRLRQKVGRLTVKNHVNRALALGCWKTCCILSTVNDFFHSARGKVKYDQWNGFGNIFTKNVTDQEYVIRAMHSKSLSYQFVGRLHARICIYLQFSVLGQIQPTQNFHTCGTLKFDMFQRIVERNVILKNTDQEVWNEAIGLLEHFHGYLFKIKIYQKRETIIYCKRTQ